MIKKLYLILISFFLIESVYSKEIRSRFGFFIDVPSDYTALQDQNINELLKDFEGSELDKEYTNEVLAGMTKTEMNIEYYFPNKAMDPAINNMYMMVMNGNIKEYFAYDIKELCSEMKSIFSKMYNNGDPMPSVNESHKNLIDYMNKGLFTIGNLDTFLQTLYDLCLADNFMTEGQKHQLTYYCEYFKTHSDIANKLLALMNPENALNQLDKIFGDTEFDVDGRPIDKNDEKVSEEKEKSNSRNKYTENYEKIFGKKNSNEEKSEKSSINSELTLQDQLAGELLKLYPNSEVKKINDGNKLDIHLPDVNKRKGTHICFNCAKTGEIKIHFFSRDKLFNEDIIKNGSDILEEISGRIRLIKNPSLRTVKDAIKIADHLIKVLLSSPKTKKEDSEKSKTNKKLTLQDQLADELLKLYPNADVKKINDGNYLDIHMSVIHSRKGTHLWFNTPKAGGIKVGFFCRDEDFKEETLKNHPNLIEAYSNGLRLKGHPIYSDIETALDAAKNFIGYLKTKDTEIEVKKEGEEGKPTGTIEDSQDISTT